MREPQSEIHVLDLIYKLEKSVLTRPNLGHHNRREAYTDVFTGGDRHYDVLPNTWDIFFWKDLKLVSWINCESHKLPFSTGSPGSF